MPIVVAVLSAAHTAARKVIVGSDPARCMGVYPCLLYVCVIEGWYSPSYEPTPLPKESYQLSVGFVTSKVNSELKQT
jgi:hypothetical protein